MKMTIEEALKKYKTIYIKYLWVNYCRKCRKPIYEHDEEYSLDGGFEDWKEFNKDYGILELDEEIEQTNDNNFVYFREDPTRDIICEECQRKRDEELMASIED